MLRTLALRMGSGNMISYLATSSKKSSNQPELIRKRFKASEALSLAEQRKSWLDCRLCDLNDWEDPEFLEVASALMQTKDVPKHRKVWEFVVSILALRELGHLNSKSLGLSVAAGNERILFYLANLVGGMVATDIYGAGNFSDLEAAESFLYDQKSYAPFPYKEDNLKALYSDALDLKLLGNSFDFCICLSSIEHFGGLRPAIQSIKEMARVLKPGGHAIIITEISLNDIATDQVFNRWDIPQLIKGSGFSLVNDFNFATSKESLEHLCDMRSDDLLKMPHINLKNLCSIFTSGILILEKEAGKGTNVPNDTENKLLKRKEELWNYLEVMQTKPITPLKEIKLNFKDRVRRKLRFLYWKAIEIMIS